MKTIKQPKQIEKVEQFKPDPKYFAKDFQSRRQILRLMEQIKLQSKRIDWLNKQKMHKQVQLNDRVTEKVNGDVKSTMQIEVEVEQLEADVESIKTTVSDLKEELMRFMRGVNLKETLEEIGSYLGEADEWYEKSMQQN